MLHVKPLNGPSGAMATPTKQQCAEVGQAGSERAGQEREGRGHQLSILKTVTQLIQARRRALKKVLQGEQGMNT